MTVHFPVSMESLVWSIMVPPLWSDSSGPSAFTTAQEIKFWKATPGGDGLVSWIWVGANKTHCLPAFLFMKNVSFSVSKQRASQGNGPNNTASRMKVTEAPPNTIVWRKKIDCQPVIHRPEWQILLGEFTYTCSFTKIVLL